MNGGFLTRGLRKQFSALAAAFSLLTCIVAQRANAQFINGGFQNAATAQPQPFGPAWLVEYAQNGGAFSPSPPAGHPAAVLVTTPQNLGGGVILPILCDTQMARINDLFGYYHSTSISQTVVLRAEDIDACGVAHVRVCWVGVLQNVNHPPAQQPYFEFELIHTVNGNGTVVDRAAFLSGQAATAGSGWLPASSNWYKQTCTSLVVLNAAPGQLLTMRMEAGDCAIESGSHGAMAYLDCVEILPGFPVNRIEVDANGCGDVEITNSGLLLPETWLPATFTTPFVAGDFDGDGLCDLADIVGSTIRIIRSNGASFAFGPMFPDSGWINFIAGDFDGDGASDIAGWTGTTLKLHRTNPPTPWTTWSPVGGSGIGTRFWVGDFNRDCMDDLVRLTSTNVQVALASGIEATPFGNFTNWGPNPGLPSFTVNSDLYVCDFNGDNRDDLMLSWTTGVHVFLSTGSSFRAKQKWSSVGPPASGSPWFLGNFDCDNRCDIARYNTNGIFDTVPLTPPGTVGSFPPLPLTYIPVTPTYTVVGDFDGNGRDDFACSIPGVGMQVLRTCTGCPCMHVAVEEPICDPLDATVYTMPVTITNHSGVPVQTYTFTPNGAFSVNPPGISFATPTVNGQSRTIVLTLTGVTPGVLHSLDVVVDLLPGSDPGTCTEKVCFTPPECDCMDVFSENVYCKPDDSGTICFDFTVQNTSGVPVHSIRLTPPGAFSPDTIAVSPSPLLTGQSYPVTLCVVEITAPPGSSLAYTVELLDAAGNVVCEQEGRSFDVRYCPPVLGWCCTGIGQTTSTAVDCAAVGGIYSSTYPLPNWCPINLMPREPGGATLFPLGDAYVTIDTEQRTLVAGIGSSGQDGVSVSINAAAELLVPFEPFAPDATSGAGIDLRSRGALDGNADAAIGDLSISVADGAYSCVADFTVVGAQGVYAIVTGEQAYEPIFLLPTDVSAVLGAAPRSVRLVQADFPVASHGFVLEFGESTQIQVHGSGAMFGHELRLLAEIGGDRVDFFTDLEIRASNLPFLGLGTILTSPPPCPGDVNGDCFIDQSDLDLVTAALGLNAEGDINGDGVTDQADVGIVLSNFNTSCACRGTCPSPLADNFDSYAPGEICGQGGWEAWSGSTDVCGLITSEQASSGIHSLKIVGSVGGSTGLGDDTVHQFDISGGHHIISMMTYVPVAAQGTGWVVLLNTYPAPFNWSMNFQLDADASVIRSFEAPGDTTPLIRGQWAPLEIDIDLDADSVDCTYNGIQFITGRSWTNSDGSPGPARLQAIDLYGGEPGQGGTTGTFFDDLVVREICDPSPPPGCPGDVTGDSVVDLSDLALLLSNFGGPGGASDGDLNGDGLVDLADLAALLSVFGSSC